MKKFLLRAMADVGLENYFFLTCDVGDGILDDLPKKLGPRFINVGVAEANAMGIAAGIASATEKVFVYSIAAFAITRALEHLKLDIAFHRKNVTVIGVGAGFYYGAQGYSHYALDDIAHAMAIAELAIFNPATPSELEWCLQQIKQRSSPCYLRLSRYSQGQVCLANSPQGESSCVEITVGKALSIVVSGVLLGMIWDLRREMGGDWQIISVPCLRPLAMDDLGKIISNRKILVVEEAISVGSLGERLSKYLLEEQRPVEKFRALTMKNVFPQHYGSEEYMRQQFSLNLAGIREVIVRELFACNG